MQRKFIIASKFAIALVTPVIVAVVTNFEVAGELEPQQNEWYKKYKTQENAPKPEDMLLNTDPEPDLKVGFTLLLNGKDLTGWTPKGGNSNFEMKDGLLVGTCVPNSPSTYLCTDKMVRRNLRTELRWLFLSTVAERTQSGPRSFKNR